MDESQKQVRINNIAHRYETEIHQQFGKYVDFSKYDDMRTNVFILEHSTFLQKYTDKDAASAFHDEKDSCIYLDESLFFEDRTLVHEYIHRISTLRLADNKTITGIRYSNDPLYSWNEILTEYLCFKITNQKSNTSAYWIFDFVFDLLDQHIGYEKVKCIYFKHKQKYLKLFLSVKGYKACESIITTVLYPSLHYEQDHLIRSAGFDIWKAMITEVFSKNVRQNIISFFDPILLY